MASECFVLDEWLLHDLGGDNGPQAQAEAYLLLKRIKTICDHIAVVRNSAWTRKAYDLMSASGDSMVLRAVSKYLHASILRDSQKCRFLNRDEICGSMPPSVAGSVPEDDRYLVEAYCAANAKLLVTTDGPLAEALLAAPEIKVELRGDFVSRYCSQN